MGALLLYQNFITAAAQLTATSLAQAQILGITRLQAGSVTFEVQGVYTGTVDTTYRVEIQVGSETGAFLGTTYRWTDNWHDTGSVTWNAENLIPVANSWILLSQGVQIRFVAGVSLPYFITGDNWSFRARLPYGLAQVIDYTRNTEVRSAAMTPGGIWSLTFDAGAAVLPQALALLDHNLLSTSVLRLKSSNASNFAGLLANETIAWQAQKRCYLPLSTTPARYWRLEVTAGSGQSDIRLGECYLGRLVRLSRGFRIGYTRHRMRLGGSTEPSLLASGPGVGVPDSESYQVTFGQRREADRLALETLWQSLNDWTQGTQWPFYLVPNDADLSTFGLYHWANDYEELNIVDGISEVTWQLQGVTRSLI